MVWSHVRHLYSLVACCIYADSSNLFGVYCVRQRDGLRVLCVCSYVCTGVVFRCCDRSGGERGGNYGWLGAETCTCSY